MVDAALVIAILLSLGSLVFVFLPIRRSAARPRSEEERALLAEKTAAIQLLADLEHDRFTGKLTEDDYRESRGLAEGQAISAMKRLDALDGGETDDPIEKLIQIERARLQKEGMR